MANNTRIPKRGRSRFGEIEQIEPQRYVWHVCSRGGVAAIVREGLVTHHTGDGVIYANNQSENLGAFFPYVLYGFYDRSPLDGPLTAPTDDIFRIDTRLCTARWYTDPYMFGDLGSRECLRSRYIFTPQNIPAFALRRYRILPSLQTTFAVKFRNGVASTVRRMPITPYAWVEGDRRSDIFLAA